MSGSDSGRSSSGRTALLVIDLQKGEYNPEKVRRRAGRRLYVGPHLPDRHPERPTVAQPPAGRAGIEVVYTTIESLTLDGRDRSLDYKISGIFAAKGSR